MGNGRSKSQAPKSPPQPDWSENNPNSGETPITLDDLTQEEINKINRALRQIKAEEEEEKPSFRSRILNNTTAAATKDKKDSKYYSNCEESLRVENDFASFVNLKKEANPVIPNSR